MSSPSSTTAKSSSRKERAAVAQAAKLMASKPAMGPAAALRKAGVTSAAKIKQLSAELRRRQADGARHKSSRTASARGGQTAAATKALSSSRGDTKKDSRPSPPPEGREGSKGLTDPFALQNDAMSIWLKLYAAWWSQMMKWSPVAFMTPGNRAGTTGGDLASVQWFSKIRG